MKKWFMGMMLAICVLVMAGCTMKKETTRTSETTATTETGVSSTDKLEETVTP